MMYVCVWCSVLFVLAADGPGERDVLAPVTAGEKVSEDGTTGDPALCQD